MTNQIPDRPRIFSHMTRTRFLHVEDALDPISPAKPGKVRFFIGAYAAGSGQPAKTAHHFLDDADARVLFADIAQGKSVDITDYKGTTNGSGAQSRVLKVKGPTDKGKYWLQISMGPGEVIGQGAVKPAGSPEVEISVPLTVWEARKMALAVIEYMSAFRVAALLSQQGGFGDSPGQQPTRDRPQNVDPETGEINPLADEVAKILTTPTEDLEELFGPEEAAQEDRQLADHIGDEVGPEPEGPKEAKAPAEAKPATFYALANEAITAGLLDKVQELIQAPGSWREKTTRLQQAMAA